jgi:hypothetical protein
MKINLRYWILGCLLSLYLFWIMFSLLSESKLTETKIAVSDGIIACLISLIPILIMGIIEIIKHIKHKNGSTRGVVRH